MNKKRIIIITLALMALSVPVYLFFIRPAKEAGLAAGNGVFRISNKGNANIDITFSDSDEITVKLRGPKEEVDKMRFFKIGYNITEFGQTDIWQDVEGEITVPKGTVLEVSVEDGKDITLKNKDDEAYHSMGGGGSYIVNTGNVKKISLSGGGIAVQTGDGGGNDGGNADEENEDSSVIVPLPPPGPDEKPAPAPEVINCGVGAQAARDLCCQKKMAGHQTPGCVGGWIYYQPTSNCQYQCLEGEAFEQYVGGGVSNGDGNNGGGGNNGGTPVYIEKTAGYCKTLAKTLRDDCCNDGLKNELSIGPRPGFPDCIGNWHYAEKAGVPECRFECASHGEMLKILQEIRENQ